MLNNATEFWEIYIVAGYTDLHRGIDGWYLLQNSASSWIHMKRISFFLFCGR